jgi:transposase
MRGQADEQLPLFHVFNVEARIRRDQPLRDIKRRVDRVLRSLGLQFQTAYSTAGRPSMPPDRLLESLLLLGLYSIRSERQFYEAIELNLLYRWFLDVQPSEEAFGPTIMIGRGAYSRPSWPKPPLPGSAASVSASAAR